MHKTGRPVLVGTTSVERSERLAELLKEADIKCQVQCAICSPPIRHCAFYNVNVLKDQIAC